MAKTDISFGGQQWAIESPLKFPQLRVIEPAVNKIIILRTSGGPVSDEYYIEAEKVIVSAIGAYNPDFTTEKFNNLPTTPLEIIDAVKAIAKAANMWKEPEPGEAKPGETPAKAQ